MRRTRARDSWIPLPAPDFTGENNSCVDPRPSRQLWEAGADGKERNVESKDKRLTSQSLRLLSRYSAQRHVLAQITEAAMRSRGAESVVRPSDTCHTSRRLSCRNRLWKSVARAQPPRRPLHPAGQISLPPLKGSKDAGVVKEEPYPEWSGLCPQLPGVTSRAPEGPA